LLIRKTNTLQTAFSAIFPIRVTIVMCTIAQEITGSISTPSTQPDWL